MKLIFAIVTFLSVLSVNAESSPLIQVDNAQQLTEVRQIVYKDAIIRDVVFQPNDNRLAVIKLTPQTTLDGEVIFLDRLTLREIGFTDTPMSGTVMTFSPDGSLFALGNEKGEVRLYDGKTLEERETYQASSDIVNDLAISSDNAYLGATFAIPTLVKQGEIAFRLLTLPEGKEVLSYPLDEDVYGGGVAFDENSQSIFFSTINMATPSVTVSAFNVKSGEELAKYENAGSSGHDLLFSPKAKSIFFTDSEGIQSNLLNGTQNQILGSTQEGESIRNMTLHPTEPILAVGYFKRTPRPDGGPSATNAGIIRLYNTETGDELISIDVPEGAITSLAFSPDGTLLASGGTDGTVRLWGVPGE